MTNVTREFIQGLPKAELHLHLEGSLEPELKLTLAKKNNIDIGQTTIEEVRASYQFDSLTSFLAVYYPAMNVLQDESDFYELAMAYFRRAKENGVKAQVKQAVAGGNNAGVIHKTAGGVKTLTVSLPCRYLHSPSCVLKVEDIYESAKIIRLLAEDFANA